MPGEIEPRQLDAILEHEVGARRQRRVGANQIRHRPRLQITKELLGEVEAAIGFEIARQDQRCVRGVIVGPEECVHVIQRRGQQVRGRADGRPVIRMVRREHRGR